MFPPFDPEKPDTRRKPRARRRPRLRQVPIRILIPNIFTLLGLCAGLTAIRMAIEGRYDVAVAAVILAAVLDGLDGPVARLLKATSRFGAELDSLADFVNFGVAPAIMIFTWALGPTKSIGWIIVLCFSICAALRLARFNVALDNKDEPTWKSGYFMGAPAPAGAIVVLLPLYLHQLGLTEIRLWTPVILFYTAAIALLMVSRMPTFSSKMIGQRIERDYVLPVFVVAALFVAVLLTYPYATLAIGVGVYLAILPLGLLSYRRQEQKMQERAVKQNGSRKKPKSEDRKKPGTPEARAN